MKRFLHRAILLAVLRVVDLHSNLTRLNVMKFLDSLFRRENPKPVTPSRDWQTYCGFSLAERLDQLTHEQVVYLKQLRFSEHRDETLGALLKLSTGETLRPGVTFEAAILQILDPLNAKAPHESGNLKREFRKLMAKHESWKGAR